MKTVSKPENYGVAVLKKQNLKISEKPKKISSEAITGLYFFDKEVVKFSQKLKPSKKKRQKSLIL